MQKNAILILAALFACVLLGVASVALVADTFSRVPDFTQLRSSVEYWVYLPDGSKEKRTLGPMTPQWVPMNQISNHLLMAVIASEDTSFFSHDGIDLHEIKESIRKDIKEKRWARGASTITQQVVKNVYLGREKTLWRKGKEILWARRLDATLSKSEILCLYVNLIEWGPNIYGIRAAARHYFSTSPAQLSAKQSAFLALLVPAPTKFYAYFKSRQLTEWADSRVQAILRVMNRMGFLDESEYQIALNEQLWGVPVAKGGEEPTLENVEMDEDVIPIDPEEIPAEPVPAPTPAPAPSPS